jgi:hypothetical protein
LLKRVRWPIAGRIPLSSRLGRMVSRNIPLGKKKHLSYDTKLKCTYSYKYKVIFFKLKPSKGEIYQECT